jgi:hypothetical protein
VRDKTYNENGFNETGVVGSTTTYTHTDPSKVTGCDSTTTLRLTGQSEDKSRNNGDDM